jgi:hypothetical protein
MKLKKPVTITITESDNLAFLWHVCNHAEYIAKGKYDLNGISAKALGELGYRVHRTVNETNMWKTIDGAVQEQKLDVNTGRYKIKPIEVKLNNEYTAQVTPTEVVVGCQTISHEAVRALCDAVNKIGS